jgi:hypothetical protein
MDVFFVVCIMKRRASARASHEIWDTRLELLSIVLQDRKHVCPIYPETYSNYYSYTDVSAQCRHSSRNLNCSAMNLILSFLVIGKQWSTLGDRHIHTTYPSVVIDHD